MKKILHDRELSTAVGDEGGFAPTFDGTEDAIETVLDAVKKAGYKPGTEICLALDCASTEFLSTVNMTTRNLKEKVGQFVPSKNKWIT